MKLYVLVNKKGIAEKVYLSANHVTLKLKHNPDEYEVITVPFQVECVHSHQQWMESPDRRDRVWLEKRM